MANNASANDDQLEELTVADLAPLLRRPIVFPGALAPLSTNSGVRSLTGCDIGCGRVGVYEDDRVGVRVVAEREMSSYRK